VHLPRCQRLAEWQNAQRLAAYDSNLHPNSEKYILAILRVDFASMSQEARGLKKQKNFIFFVAPWWSFPIWKLKKLGRSSSATHLHVHPLNELRGQLFADSLLAFLVVSATSGYKKKII